MKNAALNTSGIIFLLISVMHFVRFFKGWHIVIGQHHIPLHWSIYGGTVTALLAVWMFVSASKKR